MTNFIRNNFTYTALFCEENIWKLIQSLYSNQFVKPIDVLFILNKSNSVALYEQRIANKNAPVIWDYHVILSAQIRDEIVIFDFDSLCSFPVSIQSYFSSTFKSNNNAHKSHNPQIKPIPADYYYENFYSDRKHMLGIIDRNKLPKYDFIKSDNRKTKLTLMQCRSTIESNTLFYLVSTDDYLKTIYLI